MTAGAVATAVILCGGRTSRFGGEKALCRVGGRRVIDRVVEAVRPLSAGIIAVSSPEKRELDLPAGVQVVVDLYPGSGPLGAICTGLIRAETELAVVVGGDMPFLNGGLLQWLVELAGGYEAVVPRLEDGWLQPLHAVYSRARLPEMQRRVADGRLAVWRLLREIRTRYVSAAECLPLDPGLLSFFNLNTPEDLERAERLAGEAGPPPE